MAYIKLISKPDGWFDAGTEVLMEASMIMENPQKEYPVKII